MLRSWKDDICEMLHTSSPGPNNLLKPDFSTNIQVLFSFDNNMEKGSKSD